MKKLLVKLIGALFAATLLFAVFFNEGAYSVAAEQKVNDENSSRQLVVVDTEFTEQPDSIDIDSEDIKKIDFNKSGENEQDKQDNEDKKESFLKNAADNVQRFFIAAVGHIDRFLNKYISAIMSIADLLSFYN